MKKNNRHSIGCAKAVFFCLSAILVCCVLFAQQDGPIYIKAKKIYTSDSGRILTNGGILVQDGKIVRVDEKIKPPKNAKMVDFS